MERMKTFLLYALGIIGFIFLSYVLENGLIENMYVKMNGNINSTVSDIIIQDVAGKASNVNGFMKFKLTSNSNNANGNYIKIDLYSKQGNHAGTKYVQINDLEQGHSKEYQVKFKGNEIRSYNVSVVKDAPDRSNIISIFGWEIDLSNIFGIDLSNASIFGAKLSDIFNIDNLKTTGKNAWSWTINFLNTIPWWGYAIGAGIILWYMPSRFLFGIFPI